MIESHPRNAGAPGNVGNFDIFIFCGLHQVDYRLSDAHSCKAAAPGLVLSRYMFSEKFHKNSHLPASAGMPIRNMKCFFSRWVLFLTVPENVIINVYKVPYFVNCNIKRFGLQYKVVIKTTLQEDSYS